MSRNLFLRFYAPPSMSVFKRNFLNIKLTNSSFGIYVCMAMSYSSTWWAIAHWIWIANERTLTPTMQRTHAGLLSAETAWLSWGIFSTMYGCGVKGVYIHTMIFNYVSACCVEFCVQVNICPLSNVQWFNGWEYYT